ncbi:MULTISPECIES: type II toxin-antitoxin system PemK/MazF family toxin [Lactobacillaceae]|uniref:type II toxin-antitoxin system PemK/MazF family toxin n=1 Tax=Lactobacillaceae TaxID=33958 RepID=UPI001E64616D|nr:type II toxin-antitoxin system PemK/MazF family toxin [Lactobacillus sp. HBUAS51381]
MFRTSLGLILSHRWATHEIRKRRPALVLSHKGYSQLTNLVVVCPITHAANNALRSAGFLIRLPDEVSTNDGYINSLQFQALDFRSRHIKYITKLDTPTYLNVRKKVFFVID